MSKTLYELDTKGDVLLNIYNAPDGLPQNLKELDGDMLAGFPEPSKAPPKQVQIPANGETKEENGDLEAHDQPVHSSNGLSKKDFEREMSFDPRAILSYPLKIGIPCHF